MKKIFAVCKIAGKRPGEAMLSLIAGWVHSVLVKEKLERIEERETSDHLDSNPRKLKELSGPRSWQPVTVR